MNKQEFLARCIQESLELKRQFFEQHTTLVIELAAKVEEARERGRKVLIFGNGGSAADAQHFAAELMHRVEKTRIGVRAIALHADTSLVTALANDEGFARVYARQIETLAVTGDIALAISTSGMSANIVDALGAARERGCFTAGLLGRDGGRARELCSLALVVPGNSTARIQEVHGMIIHLVCQLLERS